MTQDKVGQDGGDQHVCRNRNAVGGSQCARAFKHHHGQDDGDEQRPIDEGNIDLADLFHIGKDHAHAWQVTQTNDLFGDAEGTSNQSLRSNDGGKGCQNQVD